MSGMDAASSRILLAQRMRPFERHLTWRVFACIAAGTGLGYLFTGAFTALGALGALGAIDIAKVNLPASATTSLQRPHT